MPRKGAVCALKRENVPRHSPPKEGRRLFFDLKKVIMPFICIRKQKSRFLFHLTVLYKTYYIYLTMRGTPRAGQGGRVVLLRQMSRIIHLIQGEPS